MSCPFIWSVGEPTLEAVPPDSSFSEPPALLTHYVFLWLVSLLRSGPWQFPPPSLLLVLPDAPP